MAQTIKELEKERAEILDAIESQAQNMSQKGSPPEHNLKDWLNAAEEIMPAKKSSRQKTPLESSSPVRKKDKTSKSSFFGVIIMLSLLLTVLGVLYIAYTSIHNELQKVLAANAISQENVESIKETVVNLEKSIASGGQGELFKSLQAKVAHLEAEVNDLKTQQIILKSSTDKITGEQIKVVSGVASQLKTSEDNLELNKLVTSEELDRKLANHAQQINDKLEEIIQHLNILPATEPVKQVQAVKVPKETPPKEAFENISLPKAPKLKIQEPKIQEPLGRLNQPAISLVQRSKPLVQPELPKPPLLISSPEIDWIINEPAVNFTLQLASMPSRAGIQKVKDQKGLVNAKIIPQERNGRTQYVLVLGSFTDRHAADVSAKNFQTEYKISPWVRRVQDLKARIKSEKQVR